MVLGPMFEMLPVVSQHVIRASPSQHQAVEALAERLIAAHPRLNPPDWVIPMLTRRLDPGPTFHLDDLSDIAAPEDLDAFIEDRAAFRAKEGDVVASCSLANDAFKTYCRETLGLGDVRWLHPHPRVDPSKVASACWTDREARQALIAWFRSSGARNIHPHMGSRAVWILASLLHKALGRPVQVIGPPPGLTRLVNDKAWFTKVVQDLFGGSWAPPSIRVENFASLAYAVRHLAKTSRRLVIKIPDAAGGAGNIVLSAERFRGKPVGQIRQEIREILAPFHWRIADHLLVSSWESDVLRAPSVQTWIPPEGGGDPVVEGLYDQFVVGETGRFAGSQPADYREQLTSECVTSSWLLARLFQRLGYVGRCSFDLLLLGEDLESARIEFIECNGRWGGTSGPMTLMNRLFGDWKTQCYATHEVTITGLQGVTFLELLQVMEEDLYDARHGRGDLILFNPGSLAARSSVHILTLGSTWGEAAERAHTEIPEKLRTWVA